MDRDLEITKMALDAMAHGPSYAIEQCEKRAQYEINQSKQLPRKSHPSRKVYIISQYKKMGIVVLSEVDDLFFSVVLPEGWEIKPTDHHMWNDLFDDKGRKRASFFYKGSIYDRDAFIDFCTRYRIAILPADNYKDDSLSHEKRCLSEWHGVVLDGEKEIYRVSYTPKDKDDYFWHCDDILRQECRVFLEANYPDYQNINAYWD